MNYSDTIGWIDRVLAALRESLRDLGFQEFLPAILSSRFEPGARHSVAVLGHRSLPVIESTLDPDGNAQAVVKGQRSFFLPVSHCVEKQLVLEHANKVFCIAPCVRLLMEGEHTSGRHLYSFFQVEVELRTKDINDVFVLGENLLQTFSSKLLDRLPTEWSSDDAIADRVSDLGKVPFPRTSFDEARRMLPTSELGARNPHNPNDLSHAEEEWLANSYSTPFWLYDYPEDVRDCPFHRNERGNYDTLDLMLPKGYGELATGGLRPQSYEEIIRLSKKMGRDVFHPDYANWKRRAGVQTGGFGIGLERLIRYCTGCDSILDIRQPHDSGPNATIASEEA